jgi:hypothetical protein
MSSTAPRYGTPNFEMLKTWIGRSPEDDLAGMDELFVLMLAEPGIDSIEESIRTAPGVGVR